MTCTHGNDEHWILARMDTRDSGVPHWNACPYCTAGGGWKPPTLTPAQLYERVEGKLFSWTGADGRVWGLEELSDNHLLNILNDSHRAGRYGFPFYIMQDEAARRGLPHEG